MFGSPSPVVALLVGSLGLLALLVGLVVARKLRRDADEAAAVGRRERFRLVLAEGDTAALRAVAIEARSGLSALRDLCLSCRAVDPLPAPRLAHVHEGMEPLVRVLPGRLRARDPVVRGQFAVAWACLRRPEAEEALAPLLRDRDADVRLAACGALAWLATDRAAVALIAALAEGALPPPRLVERLGHPWAADAVIRELLVGLLDASLAVPRAALAQALGLAGVTKAEAVLLELLRLGVTEERISAARALGSCGTRQAVGPLTRALDDGEWSVRSQAAKSLGLIGDAKVIPALVGLLGDEAWWVRASAAGALRRLGADGLAALQQLAADHIDRFARDRAREALALERVARTREARV
jgi:HEAT repeat protein